MGTKAYSTKYRRLLVTILASVILTALIACGGGDGDSGVPASDDINTPVSNPAALPSTAYYYDSNKYWAIHQISDRIYSIAEPNYAQKNFSYLIIGTDLSLLIDSGASVDRDITRVVAGLTGTPVVVLPSHLHFDHIGGLRRFSDIWLIDSPFTRALQGPDGRVVIPPEVHIAVLDGPNPKFKVVPFEISRWLADGETIDIGGTVLRVVSTPGHQDAEVVVYDVTDNILFTGDHMYPSNLYVEKTDKYLESAKKVLGIINSGTKLYGAHGNEGNMLPLMTYQNAVDVKNTLQAIEDNQIQGNKLSLPDWGIDSALSYAADSTINLLRLIVFSAGVLFGKN